MNIDRMLQALKERGVDYILIGGVNFLLQHAPELTFDLDIWVADTSENLERLNGALIELGAAWGATEKEWKSIPADAVWLKQQAIFCLTTNHGALDVFREVRGLEGKFAECKAAARRAQTATGMDFAGLSDRHMLACQEALPLNEQKPRRMEILRRAIAKAEAGRQHEP